MIDEEEKLVKDLTARLRALILPKMDGILETAAYVYTETHHLEGEKRDYYIDKLLNNTDYDAFDEKWIRDILIHLNKGALKVLKKDGQ